MAEIKSLGILTGNNEGYIGYFFNSKTHYGYVPSSSVANGRFIESNVILFFLLEIVDRGGEN